MFTSEIPEPQLTKLAELLPNVLTALHEETTNAITESENWEQAKDNIKNAMYQIEGECKSIREALS